MSLIDIHIQTEEFAAPIDCYDEMNVQLADDDQIESRCGEIYISQRKILIFVCTECKENFYGYDDFFTHLCEQHISSEEELKYEPSEGCTNEEFVDENLIVLMDQGDDDTEEDVKPQLKPIQETEVVTVAGTQDFSQELLDTFESIDEYETLDETEGNRTVTFLNDFSKFLEKDHKDFDAIGTMTADDDQGQSNCSGEMTAGPDKPPAALPNARFECEQCHKCFLVEAKYRTHVKHHNKERKFKCTICGFAFTEEFNLRAHLRRHNGDKPHACEECGKRFTTRNEVKAHLRSHTGERPYICEICGQSYVTSGSLNEHKKRHTNYRPHKCQLCDKTFFDTGLLKEHVVMHTGERKHVCEVCEASFTRRKALLQHMKLHSGVKQYKCMFCDKAFAQKPGLASHLKTHRNLLTTVKKEAETILPDDSSF